MNILVTGGAGFIGSHIVDALLARGHEVKAIDIAIGAITADLIQGDIATLPPARLLEWFEMFEFRPDAICHQAAQPSLRRSIEAPAEDAQTNIIGTINVIEAARAVGAHVVFASTSAVYDPAGGVFTEDSPIMPNLPYGIAKASAEMYLRNSGISHTILRYGNVYGPRQVAVGENQLIPHALAHIFDGAPFVINGDGKQSRDWVYVEDIARANVLALEERVQGTFNCGGGVSWNVNEVCGLLQTIAGWPGEWQHGPAKPGEARRVTLDSLRAKQTLGWRAQVSMHDGLRATVAAWRAAR